MSKLGIVLAAGKGTRLFPCTQYINKHLLNVYNKPMIYYPLANLIMLGCKKIIIITNAKDAVMMEKIVKILKNLNIDAVLKFQSNQSGIPTAMKDAIKNETFDELYTILGDNIFIGNGFLDSIIENKSKNLIITKRVKNPEQFGVLHKRDGISEVIEKPKAYLSDKVVTGFYKFSNDILSILEIQKPSERGETEISDVLNHIMRDKNQIVDELELNRGTLWLDAGTFDNLSNCNILMSQISQRQGQDFGCIEEAAYQTCAITKSDLKLILKDYPNNSYKEYILDVIS